MMSALEKKWKTVELGELADFRNGVNYNKDNFGKGIPVINVKDFQDYSVPRYDDLDEIDPEGVVNAGHHLKENDILFVRSNGNRDLIGRSVMILNPPKREITHSAFTIRTRFTSNEAVPRYYSYVLRSGIIRQVLSAHGNGANISNLNQDILNKLKVPCPPLATQRRIASILSAYDDLIENNTRRIAILEEMARRLYDEWFVKFRFPGHEDVELVQTEAGDVPSTWKIQTVEQTFDILGGGTPSKKNLDFWNDGHINWYSPTDLTKAGTSFMEESSSKITDLGLQKSSAKLFPEKSVMMTSRATIGKIAINTTEACTNQGFITCLPNDRFPLYLLFFWLHRNVDMFISLGTGATFKEITKGTFKTISLALPPRDLARAFEDKAEPLMEMILNLQRKNQNLRAQRDLLLPKLISGEIDVSQADSQRQEQ
jgi:type I restriction enzyme S subunit